MYKRSWCKFDTLSELQPLWVHNRCSGVKAALKKESMFSCRKCKGEIVPPDSLNSTQVHIGEDTFEAVSTFRYLGDVIGESGGCVEATSARITAAWNGFRELLPIITNRGIIRNILLYGCETWPASSETTRRLTSADNGMVRWICGVRLEQRINTRTSRKLGIISIPEEIRWCRLRYFGHLQRMDKIVWPRRVNDFVVPGSLPRGRQHLRWSDVITKDLKYLNIRKELADDRVQWRRAIKPRKIQLQRVRPIRDGQAR